MLRLPPFHYHQPASLAEAAALLAPSNESEPVRLVAGGTDLWPNLKRRHQTASTVVSLGRIAELAGIRESEDGVGIGAMTTLTAVAGDPIIRERYPALAHAVASISAPVLRNMGTLGGNLCLDTRCTYYNQNEEWRQAIHYCKKAAGEVCWVAPGSPRCWAISASDAAPMLCALRARVRLVSAAGERVIPLTELYQDDGIIYLTKRPDEILTEIFLPAQSSNEHCRSAFGKLRRRGAIDFAVLSAAAALWTDEAGVVTKANVFLGAVASFPTPATATAEALVGKPLSAETITHAASLAKRDATPMDNTDFAPAWRGAMAAKYVEAALRECAGLPVGRLGGRGGAQSGLD